MSRPTIGLWWLALSAAIVLASAVVYLHNHANGCASDRGRRQDRRGRTCGDYDRLTGQTLAWAGGAFLFVTVGAVVALMFVPSRRRG